MNISPSVPCIPYTAGVAASGQLVRSMRVNRDERSGAQAALTDAYCIKPVQTDGQIGYLVGKHLAGELLQFASAVNG